MADQQLSYYADYSSSNPSFASSGRELRIEFEGNIYGNQPAAKEWLKNWIRHKVTEGNTLKAVVMYVNRFFLS
jgi:hypothetical protein